MPAEIPWARHTVFFTEGRRTALLVTRGKHGYRERVLPVESGEAALAWCKKHVACLVYEPADPKRN